MKKRTEAKNADPIEQPTDGRVTVINLKGRPVFRNWLADLSRTTYMSASTIVRIALVEWARNHGHEPPPAP